MALGTLPMAAWLAPEVVLVAVVAQHRLARVDTQIHASSAAAVTAVGSATRDVRLTAHRRSPVAAIAAADGDRYIVKKHRGEGYLALRKSSTRRVMSFAAAASY